MPKEGKRIEKEIEEVREMKRERKQVKQRDGEREERKIPKIQIYKLKYLPLKLKRSER